MLSYAMKNKSQPKRIEIGNLPVTITKELDYFVASSPVLDIATQAKTLEEVKLRFLELTEIFFEEIIEAGTVEDVLTSLGWQEVRHNFVPPTVVEHNVEPVNINLPVTVNAFKTISH
jgi:predicted RNase H-like HicB family nuclease